MASEAMQQEPGGEYVDCRWLMGHYDISAATVHRWVKEKRLPAPVRLGPNTSRWKRAELRAWERAREEAAQ